MPVVPVNFGIQSNPGRFGHDGAGKLINCYAESRGQEGKAATALYARPGMTLFGSVSDNITRGMFPIDDSLYWVVGKQIYKVDLSGSTTLIGGVADAGRVAMARNTKANSPQLVIVTQGGLRFVVENDELSRITDTDLPPPKDVEFEGGYMLYLLPDGRMFYSELNDAGNVSALSFFDAEARDDGGKAVRKIGSLIWVFGSETVQKFQLTSSELNPFQPLLGATVERGCIAVGPSRSSAMRLCGFQMTAQS